MASWVYSVPSRPLESNYSRRAEIITCCCGAWPVHNHSFVGTCSRLLEIVWECLRLFEFVPRPQSTTTLLRGPAWDCFILFEIVTCPQPLFCEDLLPQAKVTSVLSNILRPCLRFCSTVISSSNTTSNRQALTFNIHTHFIQGKEVYIKHKIGVLNKSTLSCFLLYHILS